MFGKLQTFLIHSAHLVIIMFAHDSVRPSFPTFQDIAKQNKTRLKIMIAIGWTVGLAEWIIDDICLFQVNSIQVVRLSKDLSSRTFFWEIHTIFWPTSPRPYRWSLFSHKVSVRMSVTQKTKTRYSAKTQHMWPGGSLWSLLTCFKIGFVLNDRVINLSPLD